MSRALHAVRRGTPSQRTVGSAAVAGVVTGLASTYPWELGPVASLPVWAVVGVVLGAVVGRHGAVVVRGTAYGVALTIAFLYSRFGGAAGDLPAYSVFVLAMSVVGAAAGVATAWIGSRLSVAGRHEAGLIGQDRELDPISQPELGEQP